jgi:hypothetical protein
MPIHPAVWECNKDYGFPYDLSMGIFLPCVMTAPNKRKTTVEIDVELDERFRKAVIDRKGFHKGVLGEAMEEAIKKWLDVEEKVKKK